MTEERVNYLYTGDAGSLQKATSTAVKSLDTYSKAFKGISSQTSALASQMQNLSSSSNILKKAMVGLTGVQLGKWLGEGIKQSISYVENLNLFSVAMGGAIDKGTAFVDQMQEIYGMDPSALMSYSGNFFQLADAIDMPSKAAANMSLALTKASNDVASLFNMPIEKVAENFSSGMQGMSRAVRKYGMDIRATTLQQTASTLGLQMSVATTSEANRMGLRFLTMMKQASNANGDFARTIEQPANQLRIFGEQIRQLGRAIGNFFIGPLGKAIQYVNGFVMALRSVLVYLASFFNLLSGADPIDYSGMQDEADAISSVGTAAKDTAKKVKSLLAPFDELNVLQEQQADGAGAGAGAGTAVGMDPKLVAELEKVSTELEDIKMKANQVRDAILEFLGFEVDLGKIIKWDPNVLETNLINKLPQWKKSIQALFDVDWSLALSQLKEIAGQIKEIASLSIGRVITDVMTLFGIDVSDGAIAESISKLNEGLNSISAWISENKESLVTLTTRVLELFLAFQAFKMIAPLLVPVLVSLSLISKAIGVMLSLFSSIGGILTVAMGFISKFVGFLTLNLTGLGLSAVALFVAGFISGFKDMWENSEQFRENIGTLIDNVGSVIMSLVDLVGNVVNLILRILSPIVKAIGDLLQPIYPLIIGIINAVVGIVQGFVDILNGILTGDVTLVFKGFLKILMGLVEAVMNIGAGIVNAIISVIVGGINFVGGLIYSFVQGVVDTINGVLAFMHKDPINYPAKSLFVIDHAPQIVPPTFDYAFATGGVVTGPTQALIGEGKYDEAVIPLGDSPQMKELVDTLANAVRGTGTQTDQKVEVHVVVGGKEWDTFTYKSAKRGEVRVGAKPIKAGGY